MDMSKSNLLQRLLAVIQAAGKQPGTVRVTSDGETGIISAADAMPGPRVVTSMEVSKDDWDPDLGPLDICLEQQSALRLVETCQDAVKAGDGGSLKLEIEQVGTGGYRLNVGRLASAPGVDPSTAGNFLSPATLDAATMQSIGVVDMDAFTLGLKRVASVARENSMDLMKVLVIRYDGANSLTVAGLESAVFARDVVTIGKPTGAAPFTVVIPTTSATSLAHLEKVTGKRAIVEVVVDDPSNPKRFGLRADGIALIAHGFNVTGTHDTIISFAGWLDSATFEVGQIGSVDRKTLKRRIRLLDGAGDFTLLSVDSNGGSLEAISLHDGSSDYGKRQRFEYPANGTRTQVIVGTKALRRAMDAASDNPIANANGDDDDDNDAEVTSFVPVELTTPNGIKIGVLATRPNQPGVKIFVGCVVPGKMMPISPFGEAIDALKS